MIEGVGGNQFNEITFFFALSIIYFVTLNDKPTQLQVGLFSFLREQQNLLLIVIKKLKKKCVVY